MPNVARPVTLAGVSTRFIGLPIRRNCDGSFSVMVDGTGSFDAAKLKAAKVTFTDRTGIQLDGTPGGDQNVEAKLTGKLRGDADAFRVKLVLQDETGGETFRFKGAGSCP